MAVIHYCLQLLLLLAAVEMVVMLSAGDRGVCSRRLYYSQSQSHSYYASTYVRRSCGWRGSWWNSRYDCHDVYSPQRRYSTTYTTRYRTVYYCCSGYQEIGGTCRRICSPSCVRGSCDDGTCMCPSGWSGSNCNTDINECANSATPCGSAQCDNTIGSYRCSCDSGYEFSSGQCLDIDECGQGMDNCQQGCNNTDGSFQCYCSNGYALDESDGQSCDDFNECLQFNGGCADRCENTVGSYNCACQPGFSLRSDNKTCEDIDECALGTHNCTSTQFCENTPGGFTCPCKDGHQPEGPTCVDTDECVAGTAQCEQQCNNLPGGYNCSCLSGYTLEMDQFSCSDINECAANNGSCEHTCSNTEGSYECSCPDNYFLSSDGHTCTEKSCAQLPSPSHGKINCTADFLRIGTTCDFVCLSGYNLEGSDERTCLANFSWSGIQTLCAPKLCPDIVQDPPPFVNIFQPCTSEFNTSCPTRCIEGYSFENDTTVTSVSCVLADNGTSVEWMELPECVEGNPCSSSPCLHGGECIVTGPDQDIFVCNCEGTGYEGVRCESGVLSLPSLPLLQLHQRYVFQVEAYPDSDLQISFSSKSLRPQPGQITLNKNHPNASISISPVSSGFQELDVRISGPEEDFFKNPSSLLAVVAPGRSSQYFKEREVPHGRLDPGCCSSEGNIKCPASGEVSFLSTCSWASKGDEEESPGIVFATNGMLKLPLSIAGSVLKKMSSDEVQVLNRAGGGSCTHCQELDPSVSCSATDYGEVGKCYCLSPNNEDRVEFLSSEALSQTYLENTAHLLPRWLHFTAEPTQRVYSENSQRTVVVDKVELDRVRDCPNLMSEFASDGVYNVLYYAGSLNITLNDITVKHLPDSTEPFCFAVNLCDGQSPAIHISLPIAASDIVKTLPIFRDILYRGWDIELSGLSMSTVNTLQDVLPKGYQIAAKGRIDVSHNFNGLMTQFTFDGSSGVAVPDLAMFASSGLSQRITGSMDGSLSLTLEVGGAEYTLTGTTGNFTVGDWPVDSSCGVDIITFEGNDNLYTRGSNVFTELFTIPPLYRYGDRYQFDCSFTVSLTADTNAVYGGLQMDTECHNLNFGKLQLSNMKHRILIGHRASIQNGCISSHGSAFPVVVLSYFKESTYPLGNFLTLQRHGPGPHAVLSLEPSTAVYQATFENTTTMILGTMFSAPLHISNEGFQISTQAEIFGRYDFTLNVSGELGHSWADAPLTITGKHVGTGANSLADRLTSEVGIYLKMTTLQAVSRRDNADMALQKASNAAEDLHKDEMRQALIVAQAKDEYNDAAQQLQSLDSVVLELNRNLSALGSTATDFMNNLDSKVCALQICQEICVRGMLKSDCSQTTLVDIMRPCTKLVSEDRQFTQLVDTQYVSCETWQRSGFAQRNCRCGNFLDCTCNVKPTPISCCCHNTCILEIFAKVTETVIRSVPSMCVERQEERSTPRTCETDSPCATREPDTNCTSSNAQCRVKRAKVLDSIADETAMVLMKLDQAKRTKSATSTKLARLRLQVREAEELYNTSKDALKNIAVADLEGKLQQVEEKNEGLLLLADLLSNAQNQAFRISDIQFSVSVVKSSPTRFPLTIRFEVPSKGVSKVVTVVFDFDNEPLSLFQASTLVGNAIVEALTGVTPRGRRAAEVANTEDVLALQCADLESLTTFFSGLQTSIQTLKNAVDDEKRTAMEIASELNEDNMASLDVSEQSLQGLEEFNVTIDPSVLRQEAAEDGELQALLELRLAVIRQLRNIANGTNNRNLFIAWKNDLNAILNDTGESFGHECFSLVDCSTVAVALLEEILLSAPASLVEDLVSTLEDAEVNLIELSTSTDLSLEDALMLLNGINAVVAQAQDLNYWCARPPNITSSPNTNITAMENTSIVLECKAESDFPVTYKWKKDDAAVPSADKETLVIKAAKLTDMGFYTCEASNHVGTATSSWSYVEVQQLPVFYFEPSDQTRIVGDLKDILLICNATASPNPQFRWYFKTSESAEFSQLPNRTGNNLQISSPQEEHEGWYRCEAWNSGGSSYSRAAYVTILKYSTAVMAIPLRFKLISCTESNFTGSELGRLVNGLASSTLDKTNVEVANLTVSVDGNVTMYSFHLQTENLTDPDIFPEPLQSISMKVAQSRRALMTAKETLVPRLAEISTYTNEGLDVCDVSDVSDYQYDFKCGRGQRLDTDTNMICINCGPGNAQSYTTRSMLDSRGRRFTVGHASCAPCNPGYYQPDEGHETCLACPGKLGNAIGSATCDSCTYCWTSTSPIIKTARVVSEHSGVLLQWSVPPEVSAEVDGFSISVVNLSGGVGPREIREGTLPQVRAYFVHSLKRGRSYMINIRMLREGVLSAPASVRVVI